VDKHLWKSIKNYLNIFLMMKTESVLAVLDLHIQKGFMLPDPQLKRNLKLSPNASSVRIIPMDEKYRDIQVD